jgi:copper chaperone
MVERTITVAGMTCQHCVNAVTTEVSRLPGVRTVEVDLTGGRVTVASDQPLDDADLTAAVEEAGYEIRP